MGDEKSERDEGQHFQLEGFEGPLDLLLFLIKKSEINIYDIPISEITDQYLKYLEYATKIDLEKITEFYVMAATLLYIKSRMLLPVEMDLDDEFEDPRQELVDRLIEYQKFKKYSDLIQERERDAEWVVERKNKQRVLSFPEDDSMWEEIEVWELLKNFSQLMSSLSSERIIDMYEEVSINEKISLINEFLENRGEFLFTELVVREDSLMDVVCAFLAVLEMVKSRNIVILQNKFFGDIKVKAREAAETSGA